MSLMSWRAVLRCSEQGDLALQVNTIIRRRRMLARAATTDEPDRETGRLWGGESRPSETRVSCAGHLSDLF